MGIDMEVFLNIAAGGHAARRAALFNMMRDGRVPRYGDL
jgi:hypothetical protein